MYRKGLKVKEQIEAILELECAAVRMDCATVIKKNPQITLNWRHQNLFLKSQKSLWGQVTRKLLHVMAEGQGWWRLYHHVRSCNIVNLWPPRWWCEGRKPGEFCTSSHRLSPYVTHIFPSQSAGGINRTALPNCPGGRKVQSFLMDMSEH